jgi:hypothetical protein
MLVKITRFSRTTRSRRRWSNWRGRWPPRRPTRNEPLELSYFPKPNQIPHTSRYLPKDVLGQSYFTNGFEARYKAGTKESRLVLIVLDTPAQAQDVMARYRQSVSKDGKNTRDLPTPGEGGFAGKDRFYGNLAAVRQGRHMVSHLALLTRRPRGSSSRRWSATSSRARVTRRARERRRGLQEQRMNGRPAAGIPRQTASVCGGRGTAGAVIHRCSRNRVAHGQENPHAAHWARRASRCRL